MVFVREITTLLLLVNIGFGLIIEDPLLSVIQEKIITAPSAGLLKLKIGAAEFQPNTILRWIVRAENPNRYVKLIDRQVRIEPKWKSSLHYDNYCAKNYLKIQTGFEVRRTNRMCGDSVHLPFYPSGSVGDTAREFIVDFYGVYPDNRADRGFELHFGTFQSEPSPPPVCSGEAVVKYVDNEYDLIMPRSDVPLSRDDVFCRWIVRPIDPTKKLYYEIKDINLPSPFSGEMKYESKSENLSIFPDYVAERRPMIAGSSSKKLFYMDGSNRDLKSIEATKQWNIVYTYPLFMKYKTPKNFIDSQGFKGFKIKFKTM